MAVHDDLGNRMKTFYEQIPKTKLMRRTPVIIRIDGKAFHTFTKGFQKPFDEVLMKTMQETTKYLCENIQGCVLGYTQSDEITLVLIDYQRLAKDKNKTAFQRTKTPFQPDKTAFYFVESAFCFHQG